MRIYIRDKAEKIKGNIPLMSLAGLRENRKSILFKQCSMEQDPVVGESD